MHMLSLVLPCLNEQENIERTVRDAVAWLEHAEHGGEIVVVDDGSRDRTPAILAALQRELPQLRIVTHERNRGYGVALRSGLDAAVGDVVAFMDSDGQFRAEDFDRLLPLLSTCAFVAGRRRHRADPLIRKIYGKVLGLLVFAVFGLWVRDINCGMKVFRRDIWPMIRPEHGVEKLFNTEVFLRLKRAGIPWKQVDVPHYPRQGGRPTGASVRVILRMFREFFDLWKGMYVPLPREDTR